MNRREALKRALAAAVGCASGPVARALPADPIIDTHIHLFDSNRPGGVPWPPKSDTVIYRPALPARYARIARPLGVVGAIAVEASPLAADNDWVLRTAAENPIIVGVVGDLVPGSPSFPKALDQLRASTLFLGIRYGNLWNRDLSADLKKPGFVSDVQRLASAGLSLDTANPDPNLVRGILDLSQKVPEQRIIIDHLPNATLPDDSAAQKEFWANVRQLSRNPHVFVKLSEVPVRQGNRVETDVSFYRPRLDRIWDLFGEDRVLYGSDWPNSDHVASFAETLSIVRAYVSTKGRAASEKYFQNNSVAAYRWRKR